MIERTKYKSLWLNILMILPILICAAAVSKRFLNWNFDDGFIVYRYVENILAGSGWVYNAGDSHNASTSPLNTILITIVSYFNINIPLAAHLIGGISLTILGVSVYLLLAHGAPLWLSAAFAMLIVFLMGNNFTWGIETNLYYGLLGLFAYLDLLGKTSWCLLGFIVLARPDGLIIVALCTVRHILLNRQIPFAGLLKFSLVIFPWAAFSFYSFGNIFPATLKQKIWQGASGFWGEGYIFYKGLLEYIKGTTFHHLSGVFWAPVILVAPLVLTPQGLLQIIREKNYSVLILILSILTVLITYTILNVPNYHWYYTGIIVFSYICAAYGISFVIGNFKFVYSNALNVVFFLVAGYISLALYMKYNPDFLDLRTQVYTQLSQKIKSASTNNEKLAAVEVGVIGYESKLKMIDIVGLATPYGEFITGLNSDKFFEEIRPEIIVMHNPLMKHEEAVFADSRFFLRYKLHDEVELPGYPRVSYFKSSKFEIAEEGVTLEQLSLNDVSVAGHGYLLRPSDPWIEFNLKSPLKGTSPYVSFEYDLTGKSIIKNTAVMGRLYFRNQNESYSEERAVPVLLRGDRGKKAYVSLYLPGDMNKQYEIHSIRIDPVQDPNLMNSTEFAIKNLQLSIKQ